MGLSSRAELERVWDNVDPTGCFQKRFKEFNITQDGKYVIKTYGGTTNISDPKSKTNTVSFERKGHRYEVLVDQKNGPDQAKIVHVIKDGIFVEDGKISYLDKTKAYIYEGIGSNDDKDYFSMGLTKLNENFFETVDGNLVKDHDNYNTVLRRYNMLDQENKTAPFDDKERKEKINEAMKKLNDKIQNTKIFKRILKNEYYNIGIEKVTSLNDLDVLWVACDYGMMVNFSGSHKEVEYVVEGIQELQEIKNTISGWGQEENIMKQREYDMLRQKLETMRGDTDYQNKVKGAVKENILPGIVIE